MIDLRLGDCLDLLPTLEPQSIDAVIADIPYGTTQCKWDTVIPFEPMWEQLKRIAKPRAAIVLFGSQPFTSALVMSNPKWFRYEWIWEKNYSGGFVSAKKQPMRYHENIMVFSKEPTTYNPLFGEYALSTQDRFKNSGVVNSSKMRSRQYQNEIHGVKRVSDEIKLDRGAYPKSIIKIKGVPVCNGIRIHPTQKPVALMEYLVKTYTNEGDTVLDFTMGSGTTMVACVNTKRNGIGFEILPEYFEIAKKRIAEAQQQLILL